MKILVGVKRVLDYSIKLEQVRVNQARTGVDLKSLKMSINPFCEIAVEQAIRMKQAGHASHLTGLTIGDKASTETIRQSLAMGLDEAIHIETGEGLTDLHIQPLTVAKIFRHFILKNQYDLTLLGKQSIDDDSNQTGQILAGLLNYPQATFLSSLEYADGKLKCMKEIDAGIQEVSLPLPAIATVDLRLNKPRHTKIQNIIKAKKKKIQTYKLEDILENEDDRQGRLKILEVQPPTTREGGVIVESVDELLDKLKNEAKVLEMNQN